MKLFRLGLIFWMLLCACRVSAQEVYVTPLHGEISQAKFLFLRRAIKEAEINHASALVIDMDTYGGKLGAASAMRDALFKTKIPTLTYINPNAGSAGALVAICTRRIYMAPVSAIGAAAPVLSGGEDLPSTMNDKIVSYFSGQFRSAAERNGYDPDIAEAFMSKNTEVKIGDTIVHAKGSLLTLSAQEATRLIHGQPVLASGIAESLDDLFKKAHLSGEIHRVEPTGFEELAFWLTKLAPLLLLGGIVCAYIEFKTPGFGLAGTISLICFTLFFAGTYLAGLAGWEVMAIFILGLLLVLSELFVHPGTIIPGLLGGLMAFGALFWAMVDRYPSQPWLPTFDMLISPVLNLVLTAVLATVLITLLSKYLPRTSLFRALVLGAANPSGPSLSAATVSSPSTITVGAVGLARSMLRPSGNAQFGETLVDVITRGEFIEPKAALRVLAVEGSRIVVEEKK